MLFCERVNKRLKMSIGSKIYQLRLLNRYLHVLGKRREREELRETERENKPANVRGCQEKQVTAK